MVHVLAVSVWSILWSCRGSSSPEMPVPDGPVVSDALAPVDPIPVAVADPTSATMLAIASGALGATDVLDPDRGFVLVEVFDDASGQDPRADRRGQVRSADRLCGEEAVDRFGVLQADLAARSDSGTRDVFTCDGPVCTHPPVMALDKTGSYAFQAPEGHQVLNVVVRLGGVPTAPDEQQKVEAWVDEQLAALGGVGCP